MCEVFPHTTFQSSLKTFENTGFGFGIFGSEKMRFLVFQEILNIFVFEFGAFVSLQTFWTVHFSTQTWMHPLKFYPSCSWWERPTQILKTRRWYTTNICTCHSFLTFWTCLPNLFAIDNRFQPPLFCDGRIFFESVYAKYKSAVSLSSFWHHQV